MVQGINFSNYSTDQLKELRNAGVQGISDDDIKAAEQREAEAADAKTSDEAKVSYKIKDDASEVNEAQQEVETEKENGTNLKDILEKLCDKCKTKNNEMKELQQEIDKYVVKMEDLAALVGNVQTEATNELNAVEAEADKKQAEIDTKNKETEEQIQIVEEETAKGENADEDKIASAQNSIESLSGDISSIADDMKALESKSAAKIKEAAAMKAALLGASMMDVKNKAESTLKDAVNANEYADVTIEKGTEAANITDKDKAKEGGWSRRGGFLGWGKRKGDVGAANRAGNYAIALGEQLGGSSQNVVGGVKQVGTQYGFGFESTKGINEIVNKKYVDTSKVDETLDQLENAKSYRSFRNAVKNADQVFGEIAEASKKKGQKEETKTTES